MPLTTQEIIDRYGADAFWDFWFQPGEEVYAETEATHTVNLAGAHAEEQIGHPPLFEITDDGKFYLVGNCGKLYSDLPHRKTEENPIELTSLIHNTLLIVEEERLGPTGEWHFVTVISPDPEIDNKVGYIDWRFTLKLPDIPSSLPMVFDTCVGSPTKDVEVCDLSIPVWYEATQPYFNKMSCEYSVAVKTRYTDTGKEELESRMDAAVEVGVRELLEYYNKIRDEASMEQYFSAFIFADAVSWHLASTSRSSRLKVLVTIPAKYFDAIGEEVTEGSFPALKIIGLISSDLPQQINRVVDEMRRYEKNDSWKNSEGKYLGPAPNFGEFSFKVEADNLENFFFNLTRFFTNNNAPLRVSRADAIEIGVTENYEVTYILVNSPDLGERNLKVSLEALKQINPFNAPRTLALVDRLRPLAEEIKANQGLRGGWKEFLERYISPTPEYHPAANSSKNCKATFSNPFKCVPKKWRDYLQYEKDNPICGKLPSGAPLTLGLDGLTGPSLFNSIKSGDASKYTDKYAAIKEAGLWEEEELDGQEFAKYLVGAADASLGDEKTRGGKTPKLWFIGDPAVDRMSENLRKIAMRSTTVLPVPGGLVGEVTVEQGLVARPDLGLVDDEVFDTLGIEKPVGTMEPGMLILYDIYTEVAAKVNPRQALSQYFECKCRELLDRATVLESRDRLEAAIGYRTQAAAMGCGDLCGAIPILCSCLPFDWPPKFSYPNLIPFPTVDIMAYLGAILLTVIIQILVAFLVAFLNSLLDELRKCDAIDYASTNRFTQALNELLDPEDFSDEEMSQQLGADLTGISVEIPDLIRDTSVLVAPDELCSLFNGEANANTLQLVEVLIRESYPLIYSLFSNTEKIRRLYTAVGSLLDPELCDNLADLTAVTNNQAGDNICAPNAPLVEDMLEGRATEEQIRELLDEALRCDAARTNKIISIIQKGARGEDILNELIPNIFKTPAHPDGILPRSPPSIRYLEDITTSTTFESIEKAYYGEMQSNVPMLITNTGMSARVALTSTAPSKLIADQIGAPIPPSALETPNNRNSIFAAGLIEFLGGTMSAKREGEGLTDSTQFTNFIEVDNSITIELPPRRIRVDAQSGIVDPDAYDILSSVAGFGGLLPESKDVDWINDRIRIIYTVCDPPLPGFWEEEEEKAGGEIHITRTYIESERQAKWNEIKDGFSVELQRWSPGEGDWVRLFNFNSRRLLTPEIIEAIRDNFGGQEDLSGVYSPTREAFRNFLNEKWADPDIGLNQNRRFMENLNDPFGVVNVLHASMTKYINEAFVRKIGQRMAISFYSRFGDNFADQLDALVEIGFSPDESCGPNSRPPGILNVPEASTQWREAYDNSELDNPERFIHSMKYALSVIYIRIFITESFINGFIPFSYLRVQDLLSSDLYLRYFLNQLKDRIKDIEFYREIASSIQDHFRANAGVDKSVFEIDGLDPITGEPVLILLGDVYDISFSPIETDFSCIDPDTEDVSDNCVDLSPSESAAELANDFVLGNPGAKTIGYMEYVIREQFKVVGSEMERLMDTTVQNLTWEIFQNYIAWTDAPIFDSDFVAQARFSTAEQEASRPDETELGWQDATTYGYMTTVLRRYFDGDVTREEVETDEEFLSGWRNFMREPSAASRVNSPDPDDIRVIGGTQHIPSQLRIRHTNAHGTVSTEYTWERFPPFLGDRSDDAMYPDLNPGVSLRMVLDMYEGLAAYYTRLASGGAREYLYSPHSVGVGWDAFALAIPAAVTWTGEDWYPRDAGQGPNRHLNKPPLAAASDSPNSLLEAVYRTAFKWITQEAIRNVGQNLGSALNSDFKYLANGGIYTERFIRIKERTDWDSPDGPLATLDSRAKNLVKLKIQNRSDLLKGVVNISLWQSYLRDLLQYSGDLPLFVRSGGKVFFDVNRWFEGWYFGERLMLLYPVDNFRTIDSMTTTTDVIPEMAAFRAAINDTLNPSGPIPNLVAAMNQEKAFLLKESTADAGEMIGEVAQRTGMSVADVAETFSEQVADRDTLFETWTLPLFEATQEIDPDTLHDVAGSLNLSVTFNDVERIVTSLFTQEMKTELENLVGEFNNLILPSTLLPRVTDRTSARFYEKIALGKAPARVLNQVPSYTDGDQYGNAPGFKIQGDIKRGIWGVDSNYRGGDVVYPIKVEGNLGRETLGSDLSYGDLPDIWIDSTGYAVGNRYTDGPVRHYGGRYDEYEVGVAESGMPVPPAEVKEKINELSKMLFGWKVLDSYDWFDSRDRVQMLVDQDGTGNTPYKEEPRQEEFMGIGGGGGDTWYYTARAPLTFREEETKQFYPIFNPNGDYPKEFDNNRNTGTTNWLDTWYVYINSDSTGDEVVPLGVDTFQVGVAADPLHNLVSHREGPSETVWDTFLNEKWDPPPDTLPAAETDIVLRATAFVYLKEWVLKQNWRDATNRRGGLFLIYVEVSKLKDKIKDFKNRFGSFSSFAELSVEEQDEVAAVFERISTYLDDQMTEKAYGGESAISKCFLDNNPENTNPANKPYVSLCSEYDWFLKQSQQMKFYKSSVSDPLAFPPIRDLVQFYQTSFRAPLRTSLSADPQFEVLFKYIFPMPRIHSLLAMYVTDHIGHLPGRQHLFDGSKALVEDLYWSVKYAEEPNNALRPQRTRKPQWWEEPLEIPPWLIILLTPFKILTALFILVPGLAWLLNMMNWKPELPPYKRKRRRDGGQDPCR